MEAKKVYILDSTLRDGAQARGITFSVEDRLRIVEKLDDLGVSYIEAGNPASNPKEASFFELAKNIKLQHAKLVAFGSTRRKGISAEEDEGVQSLLSAGTSAVSIFGKCWDLHVTGILNTTLEENLKMVYDTISYFKSKGIETLFDAEHFFDGYKANPSYALQVLKAAAEGGADCLCLCDTNGGAMPDEVFNVVQKVAAMFKDKVIGIHCHNDGDMAVANSIMAYKAGATHHQGTLLGFGERCGNTCLTSLIPNFELKFNVRCIAEKKLEVLTSVARAVADYANIQLDDKMPYVGQNAFAHKGGMHIDGVNKIAHSFEHVPPQSVGNSRTFLLSEVAGRSALAEKLHHQFPMLTKDCKEAKELTKILKDLEKEGYHFEGAESSFELIVRRHLGQYQPYFKLEHLKIMDEPTSHDQFSSYAVVKISVKDKTRASVAEGNGPVNAMDKALREALNEFYPELHESHLTDYKVRVIDSASATAAKVRVLIESTDGKNTWTTVGVSSDVITASLKALMDAIEYKLYKSRN